MNTEIKKYTTDQIIEQLNKYTSEQAKEVWMKSNIKSIAYLPFKQKCLWADIIINNSCYSKDMEYVHVNSRNKYIMYIMSMVNAYMNISVDNDKLFDEYDKLNSSGVLGFILKTIPENEINEFRTIVQMSYDDVITNEYEPHAFILKNVTKVMEPFIKPLGQLFEKIDALDPDDVSKIVDNLKK